MTLKQLRILKGLGQQECADYLGISRRNYQNYEYDETQEKPFVHRELLAGDIDYVQLLSKMNSYTNAFSLEPEVELEEAIHCMQQLKSIKE